MDIKIIDSPMGYGKTSYLIDKINLDKSDNKYIYITPFLDEVKRIEVACKDKNFIQPTNKIINGLKINSLKNLIAKGKNIVTTHSLFSMADNELIALIESEDYILILDEVMDVVEQVNKITKHDIETMINEEYIRIEEIPYNKVIWLKDDYNGRFNDIKVMAQNDSLFMVDNTLMVWSMPVNTFKAFKDIYIATYMFDSQIQKYYYDYFSLNYTYYHVVKNKGKYNIEKTLNSDYDIEFKNKAKNLIHICDIEKLNAIGSHRGTIKSALSKSWYNNQDNELLIQKLKDNLHNYFSYYCNGKSKENMWTTFSQFKNKLKGKGYTKGFIPCNSRATNQYSHKKYLVYTVNRYLNPFYIHFFSQRNIEIDQEAFALSELLQWIWRSRIRKGEEIYLYIPSQRMRELLVDFLNE